MRNLNLFRGFEIANRIAFFPRVGEVGWCRLDCQPTTPGQPIAATWQFLTLAGVVGEKITARITLSSNGAMLFESSKIALKSLDFGVGTGPQTISIPHPNSQPAAIELYQVGEAALQLEVTSETSGLVYRSPAAVRIDPGDGPGWSWNPVDGTPDNSAPATTPVWSQPAYNQLINHDFALSGLVSAPAASPHLLFTGQAALYELRPGEQDAVFLQEVPFLIAPGQNYPVAFPILNKNWGWLIPGIWVRNFSEPLNKTWRYFVEITWSDPYHNAYPARPVGFPLLVRVGVDEGKQAYASAALALLGLSILFSIIGALAAVSGSAAAIGGGLGEKALDPPFPDPRYYEAVSVPALTETAIDDDPTVDRLVKMVSLCGWILELSNAIDASFNRLLGAYEASDKERVKLHDDRAKTLARTMRSAVRQLASARKDAVATLVADSRFDPNGLASTVAYFAAGLPDELLAELKRIGWDNHAIARVDIIARDENARREAADPERLVSVLALSMAIGARATVERDRSRRSAILRIFTRQVSTRGSDKKRDGAER